MRVLQKMCLLVLEKVLGKFWTFWDSPLRKEVKVKGNSGLLLVYYPFIPFVNRNINYAIAFRHTNDLNNVLFNFCIFFPICQVSPRPSARIKPRPINNYTMNKVFLFSCLRNALFVFCTLTSDKSLLSNLYLFIHLSQSKLFEGLEEDSGLSPDTFVPRKNIKKLVIKSKSTTEVCQVIQ